MSASARAEYDAPQTPVYQTSGENFPVALLLGGKGISKGAPLPSPMAPLPTVAGPTINTGGGAYFGGPVTAAGDIQAGRKTVGGDEIKGSKYVMSGDFRGAVLNIESRLDNVTQTLGAMPNAAPDQRQELARLVGELKTALAAVPPEAVSDATNVTKRVEALAQEATGDAPDPELVRGLGESLKRAASKLANSLPGVATPVSYTHLDVYKRQP